MATNRKKRTLGSSPTDVGFFEVFYWVHKHIAQRKPPALKIRSGG
jgi:hypothetical protein